MLISSGSMEMVLSLNIFDIWEQIIILLKCNTYHSLEEGHININISTNSINNVKMYTLLWKDFFIYSHVSLSSISYTLLYYFSGTSFDVFPKKRNECIDFGHLNSFYDTLDSFSKSKFFNYVLLVLLSNFWAFFLTVLLNLLLRVVERIDPSVVRF